MGPSSYFGNTLTDLQSGITANERNAGDTERANIAAKAAKMSAYFNMISNKARTEADARARQAEDARGYFALNMQDAQKKQAMAQEASLASQQWAEQAKVQAGTLAANERMAAANNAAMNERAKLQFSETRDMSPVAVEKLKQKEAMEQSSIIAANAASEANRLLTDAKLLKRSAGQEAWNKPDGWFTTGTTDIKTRQGNMAQVDQAYRSKISAIQNGLGEAAALVRFNPETELFEASAGAVMPQRRMIPPQASASKSERANQIASQRPDLTREQILTIVNSEFK